MVCLDELHTVYKMWIIPPDGSRRELVWFGYLKFPELLIVCKIREPSHLGKYPFEGPKVVQSLLLSKARFSPNYASSIGWLNNSDDCQIWASGNSSVWGLLDSENVLEG